MSECYHNRNITSGSIYDYCKDCGATRKRSTVPGQPHYEWHICDVCRLGGDSNAQPPV